MRISRLQILVLISVLVAGLLSALIYFFYVFVNDQISGRVEVEAENTASLYAGAIRGDLQRHLIIPRILSQDTKVSSALVIYNSSLDADFAKIVQELDRATLYLVARSQQIINSSNPRIKNRRYPYPESWLPVLTSGNINFFDTSRQVFVTLSRVEEDMIKTPLGIIVMEVSFAPYPILWERADVNMMMMRDDGTVLASRFSDDVGLNIRELLGLKYDFDISGIKFNQIYNYHEEKSYLYVTDLGINGWKLVYANPSLESRRQIDGIVALAVFSLAFLVLFFLYVFSRRAARQSTMLRRESEELRALNARLINEVEQRRKAEENLQSAEQSLEQSSKLAVIGQLSAAVGHELNQPLAAMRTYMTTVRMLLRRSRYFEAAQNMNRIDDLVDRMSGITRQMRSFARAHENDPQVFSLNSAIMAAFELMAPQLGQMEVEIERNIPANTIYVYGDRLRVEQILVNVMRNALEAVETSEAPKISIKLDEENQTARVLISDNGPGITHPDQLFEPFYTTKTEGKGLGLGLAISASYAKDMGGKLIARNRTVQGAVFELTLPSTEPK